MLGFLLFRFTLAWPAFVASVMEIWFCRFCTSGLPSDVVIQVEEMAFHLHKFALISKSGKLHRLLSTEEKEILGSDCDDKERITLPEFPGGPDAFEVAAKFCYGAKIELTSATVVAVRCAAEYLEMTEEFSEDNLISKTESFLTNSVLNSLRDSATALVSCEKVLTLAESLAIVGRCIETVSYRACTSDPSTLYGWPVTGNHEDGRNQSLWNGIESAIRRKTTSSWLEQVACLSLPLFKRLILAMKNRDAGSDVIESCLMYYAGRNIPGISRSKPASYSAASFTPLASESEQLEILEMIIPNLPLNYRCGGPSTASNTRILFGLLRTANILNAPETIRSALEKKVGWQLDQAALDDLLIPSYSYLNETLYDVDCVERILDHFLARIERGSRRRTNSEGHEEEEAQLTSPAVMLVGKLIDGYIAEIASDANLKPEKFHKLATSVPERARLFDDGLYRAVDVYLKAHPWITEAERDKVCGILDYQKLTLEACTHAAQNERLPIRSVVQVLFFEQLQLRNAIAGSIVAGETTLLHPPSTLSRRAEEEDDIDMWREAVRENQVLRLDMDSMRTRVHQLERECSNMKNVIAKIETLEETAPPPESNRRGKTLSRKFGCKFKTLVCDSHETVANHGRKNRRRSHPRSSAQ